MSQWQLCQQVRSKAVLTFDPVACDALQSKVDGMGWGDESHYVYVCRRGKRTGPSHRPDSSDEARAGEGCEDRL
jgi:hypothetical protein